MRLILTFMMLFVAVMAWPQDKNISIQKLKKRLVKIVNEPDQPILWDMKRKYLMPLVEDPWESASCIQPIMDRLASSTTTGISELVVLPVPIPNAAAVKKNGLMVTTGLLDRAKSPDQLAFAVAHELAHHELGHARTTPRPLLWTLVLAGRKKMDLETIRALKSDIYFERSTLRRQETEADVRAVQMLIDAGFSPGAIGTGLDLFDTSSECMIDEDALVETFSSKGHPFYSYWLKDRIPLYMKEPRSLFNMEIDSLETHPPLAERKAHISDMLAEQEAPEKVLPSHPPSQLHKMQNIMGTYAIGLYDWSFMLALRAHLEDPGNAEITSFLTSLLLEVYHVKNLGIADEFIPREVYDYEPDLRLANTFLTNLRKSQIHQLAYNFLTSSQRFDPESEEHIYLYWKLSTLLDHDEAAACIKLAYRQRFEDGIYRRSMSRAF